MPWATSGTLGWVQAAWALTCLVGCASVAESSRPPAADDRPARRWRYDATLSDKLDAMTVDVCFEGPLGGTLRPGKDDAGLGLRWARRIRPRPVRTLQPVGGRIPLDALGDSGCLRYSVSLTERSGRGAPYVRRVGRDLLASPHVWLWRPDRRAADAEATLRLHLPQGVRAALPWERRGDRYVLPASSFAFDAHAAFGRFEPAALQVAGGRIQVAILDGPLAVDRQGVMRWLRDVGLSVAQLNGSLPRRRALVLVVPSRSTRPVRFGAVGRGGGTSVLLLVGRDASQAALREHWVAPHEFSHLFLPFVRREHAWLPEGFATYYQDVLRARGRLITAQQAWVHLARNIIDAQREGTGRSMRAESAAMTLTRRYRCVYWAGTAFFLMADVQLRLASAGEISLDDCVARLPARREVKLWRATDVLRALDAACGVELFVPLAERVLDNPYPPYEEAFSALGIEAEEGRIEFSQAPHHAALRAAIMAPR